MMRGASAQVYYVETFVMSCSIITDVNVQRFAGHVDSPVVRLYRVTLPCGFIA